MGGQFLPPQCDGQNSARLLVPGWRAGSTFGRPLFGSRLANTFVLHIRLALDEIDAAVGALEKPEIAVAGHVDQAFDGAAVTLIINEDRRRDLVPIPRVVRMVLKVAFDRAGGDVDRDRG